MPDTCSTRTKGGLVERAGKEVYVRWRSTTITCAGAGTTREPTRGAEPPSYASIIARQPRDLTLHYSRAGSETIRRDIRISNSETRSTIPSRSDLPHDERLIQALARRSTVFGEIAFVVDT